MLATVTSKGQVTIPKEIRDLLHIRSNDKVDFVLDGEKVLLSPVKTLLDLRGAVRMDGKGDFPHERARA
jgi:AbrB family looped-hinge helix DNA binding protein